MITDEEQNNPTEEREDVRWVLTIISRKFLQSTDKEGVFEKYFVFCPFVSTISLNMILTFQ